MGQKLKIWATMTSIILLSGILGFGFSPDALATHNPNGEGKSIGCEKGVAKNNPHCVDEPPAGIESICDTGPEAGGDGKITAAELAAWINPQHDPDLSEEEAQALIALAETNAGGGDGDINEADELVELNILLALFPDVDPC